MRAIKPRLPQNEKARAHRAFPRILSTPPHGRDTLVVSGRDQLGAVDDHHDRLDFHGALLLGTISCANWGVKSHLRFLWHPPTGAPANPFGWLTSFAGRPS